VFPEAAATPAAFVPNGYVIEQQEEADFNEDGQRDVALLVVPECPETEAPTGSADQTSCRAEGRLLAILFRQGESGYRLSVTNAVSSGVGVHGDHFDGMKVHGRTLSLSGGGSSCAGQVGNNATFQFRFQDGDWYLIGTVERMWHLSDECDGGGFDANATYCAELKLPSTQACTEVSRSTNFNTSAQEATWTVVPIADREKERKVVRREAVPRKPLRRLATENMNF
jgi:hypothetical protein